MILSDGTIREALASGRIGIDPLDEDAIQPSSVDIRLHPAFRVFANHRYRVIDPKADQPGLTDRSRCRTASRSSSTPASSCSARRSSGSPSPTTSSRASRARAPSPGSGWSSTRRPGSSTPGSPGTSPWSCRTSLRCRSCCTPGCGSRSSRSSPGQAGAAPLRLGGARVQVPGPGRPDRVPVRAQLRRRVTVSSARHHEPPPPPPPPEPAPPPPPPLDAADGSVTDADRVDWNAEYPPA